MYSYLIADSTGLITRWGTCSDESFIQLQANTGETALDVTTNPLWTPAQTSGLYVTGGALAQRPAMPVTCPPTASVGAPATLAAPGGAAVSVDGVAQGTMDSSGSEQITFSDPGTYTIALSLWPYLDASYQVTAS